MHSHFLLGYISCLIVDKDFFYIKRSWHVISALILFTMLSVLLLFLLLITYINRGISPFFLPLLFLTLHRHGFNFQTRASSSSSFAARLQKLQHTVGGNVL